MNNYKYLIEVIEFLEYDEITESLISVDDFLAKKIAHYEYILKTKFEIYQFEIDRRVNSFLYIYAPLEKDLNISKYKNHELLTKEEVLKKWLNDRSIFEQKLYKLN